MNEANEPGARPLGLVATHATDPERLALAVTHGSKDSRPSGRVAAEQPVPEDRQDPGLVDTHMFGSEADQPSVQGQATERTGAIDVGSLDTLGPGRRGALARPEFADPEERRRRQALKSRLFGDSEDAVKIGRYQVLGRLGAGGMGVVYTAYDDRLDRKVAIKVLRQDVGGHSRVRLEREAQAMARLSHPNIVGVHEVGEDADGNLFVAMEFVRGVSLDRWLEQPRPWRSVLEVFIAAGRGLQAAHAAGLIHRDFKPANAMLGDDGSVKVLDFGLARAGEGDAEAGRGETSLMTLNLTRTGAMMGTPAYMSPEQFAGDALTAASDQFSLFVALYEGLYKVLPFAGDSVAALAASVTLGRPSEPAKGSDVPAWVRAVVMRGLARAPGDRFPDMAAALAALALDPVRRRRRLAAVLGLVVVSAGVSASAMRLAGADGGRCEGVAAAMDPVWSDERVAAAGAAFSLHGGALGDETWSLIQPRLATWADEWVRARGERCAAYAAGEISDMLHDRSVACLERQLARVDGMMGAFVVADANTVEQAPVAVAALPSLGLCSDADYLLAEVALPEDLQVRAQIVDGRASLERARAAIDLGDHDGALQRATEVAVLGRALGHEPLVALAEVVRGDALQWRMDADGAEVALGRGLELALASGDDRVAVEALARRIFVRAEVAGEPERALSDVAIGRALSRRVGSDVRLAWLVENNVAVVSDKLGLSAEAAAGYTQALRIAGEIEGDASFETMVSQYNYGLLLGNTGHHARAVEALDSAVGLAEQLYGRQHPALLTLLDGQASAAALAGRSREALAVCRRARVLAGRMSAENEGRLVPIVTLEAELAGERRTGAAAALADEGEALARRVFGPSSVQASYALLGAVLHRADHEADEAAAASVLKAMGPRGWADAVTLRVRARLRVGQWVAVRGLIAGARSDDGWREVSTAAKIAVGLLEVEAMLAMEQVSAAAAALDEVEAFAKTTAPYGLETRVAFHRGRIAEAAGDHAACVVMFRRAADGYATSFDADHPEFLAVRAALARSLHAIGEEDEAVAIGRDVVRLYRTLGSGFDPEAAALEAWLPRG